MLIIAIIITNMKLMQHAKARRSHAHLHIRNQQHQV